MAEVSLSSSIVRRSEMSVAVIGLEMNELQIRKADTQQRLVPNWHKSDTTGSYLTGSPVSLKSFVLVIF